MNHGHLKRKSAWSLNIRSSRIDLGTGDAFVDELFQIDIGIRLHGTGCAHGGDARSEIESRRSEWNFVIDGQTSVVGSRVEEMLVHSHQAGIDCVTLQIEHSR